MSEQYKVVKNKEEFDLLRQERVFVGSTFNPSSLSKLYLACFVGDLATVQQQSKNKTAEDLNKPETNLRYTSLLCVASGSHTLALDPRANHVGVTSFLLSKGANPNVQDTYGCTPLAHLTSQDQDRLDVAKVLLQGGANPNIRDRFGGSPLHDAAMGNFDKACELLCEFGADPNIKDWEGWTCYDHARSLPRINMILANAMKKLRGEEVVLPKDIKICEVCHKSASKRCAGCSCVAYCSKECQVAHWKEHKPMCKTMNSYIDHPMPGAEILTSIPAEKVFKNDGTMDEKEFKKASKIKTETGKVAEKRNGHKVSVVKIQVPTVGARAPMLLYNRKKTLQTMITPENCDKYDELAQMIRSKGVMGLKGYFKAYINDNSHLRILTNELLPQEPW